MNTYAIPIYCSGISQIARFSKNKLLQLCFALPSRYSLKGLALFFCCFSLLSFADSSLQRQLLPLFITLESSDSDAKSIDLAMRQIVKLGAKTLPLLKKRLSQTSNYRYLYLIEKLSTVSMKKREWNKEEYFKKRYRKAQQDLQNGAIERAQSIAQAILVLEPDISLRQDLRNFILQCKDAKFAQKVVIGRLVANRIFYSPGQQIHLSLILENRKPVLVTLDSSHNGIVLQVKKRDFSIEGGYREQTSSQVLSLEREIRLLPQETRKTKVSLPNPKKSGSIYRIYIITAKIPRCKVYYSDCEAYPNILFPELAVSSFPADYHQIAQHPLEIAESALKLGYPEHLFFASFFLDSGEQMQLIPKLIDYLGVGKMEPAILGILRRLTGKNFTDKNSWQNWWYAHNAEWKKRMKNP